MELGVGIIGYGFMGRTHTYGLINIPLHYQPVPFRVRQISVADPSEPARAAAEDTGYYRTVVEDYRELIEDPAIDVICVSSPNGFHKAQLLAAIHAGKHIYCDKPVVGELSEAKELLAVLRAGTYQAKHQMALQYRCLPATMRAKQLIEEGFLGRVFNYRSVYLHASNANPNKALAWKSDRSRGGGGTMFDMGVHLLDLMTHLLGDITAINATCQTCITERPSGVTGEMVTVDTDDAAFMTCRHESGVLGTIEASKLATGTCDDLRFEIHGEMGAMRFNLMDPNWLEVFDARDKGAPIGGMRGFKKVETLQQYPKPGGGFPNPKFSVGWIRAHMHCIYSFLECIALDKTPSPSLEDGVHLQQVLDAGYRSSEAGAWTDVDDLSALSAS